MSSITTAVAADYHLQQWVQLVKVWIYTTLKHMDAWIKILTSFSTIWIYTTLKLPRAYSFFSVCFSTIWIYTTLKPGYIRPFEYASFSTIWIYTTLKRLTITFMKTNWFFYHMNLHYSQTIICADVFEWKFFYHMNLHYSQTSIFKSCHYETRYISIWLSV